MVELRPNTGRKAQLLKVATSLYSPAAQISLTGNPIKSRLTPTVAPVAVLAKIVVLSAAAQ